MVEPTSHNSDKLNGQDTQTMYVFAVINVNYIFGAVALMLWSVILCNNLKMVCYCNIYTTIQKLGIGDMF